MTVSSTTDKSGPYNGNGVTVAFEYEFRILDATHITVILKSEAGVETILGSSDYSVSGVGDSGGGSVTLDTAPATGETLTIVRNAPFTQMTDLENQGAYFAETIEQALDLGVMRDQQLSERLDRAVTIPVSADASTLDTLIEDIVRLGDSAANIDTVAGISGAVETVAGISGDVSAVAADAADIGAVAGVAAAVTVVAGIDDEVTAVAGNAANINIVAGVAAAVSTVAGIDAEVVAVAANAENINAVAGIEAEIIAVPAQAAAAAASAQAAAESAASIVIVDDDDLANDGDKLTLRSNAKAYVDARTAGWLNIRSFGAVGDGVADDTAAFNAAISAASTAGGGVIYVPVGTYLVSNSNPGAVSTYDRWAIYLPDGSDNIELRGSPGSKIVLANGANASMLMLGRLTAPYASVHNVKISGLELDGNRANQDAPEGETKHYAGIMACNDSTGIVLEDLHIHDCQYYGAGFETDVANTSALGFHNCRVRNVLIEDVGADGFDAKDFQLNSSGNTINGLTVRRWGLGNVGSALLSGQAGLDLRSGWSATNILIEEFGSIPDQVGIRAQISSEYHPATVPVQPTHISRFTVHGDDGADSVGVRLGCLYSTASHGLVDHCGDAVRISNQGIRVSKVVGKNCVNGAVATTMTGTTSTLSSFEGCNFRENSGSGVSIVGSTEVGLFDTHVRNNGTGWTIDTTSLNAKIFGGSNAGNTTPAAITSTSPPYIFSVSGFRTKRTYRSTGAIDSLGSKDVTFAHGLPFTPRMQDCQLSFSQQSAVTDWMAAFLSVLSVDATNVVARYRVQTASATASALVGVNLVVDAYNGI